MKIGDTITITNELKRPMSFSFIGELPDGYEYKIMDVDGVIKIMGVHKDKEPIAFFIDDNRLIKIELT